MKTHSIAFALALMAVAGAYGDVNYDSITRNTRTIRGGTVYTLSEDVEISANAGESAMTVVSGTGGADAKYVVINIPQGRTLTVTGGDATVRTGAGAGIELPSDMTLFITGKGTLVATGGKAANGGNGTDGSGASRSGDSHTNGKGGSGGHGGGGAAAGIGGKGGQGASGTSGGGNESRASGGDKFAQHGANGGTSNDASNGGTGGAVYILGDVAVTVRGGSAGGSGSRTWTYGGYSMQEAQQDWFAGGGAPGGAGGGGGSAMAIGGGGGGGGSGGGGGAGAFVCVDDWDDPDDLNLFVYNGSGVRVVDEWTIRGGAGGNGGGGAQGGGGRKTNGDRGKSHDNEKGQSKSTAGHGGDGGEGKNRGGSGGLYVQPSARLTISPHRASERPPLSNMPNFMSVTVTLDLGLKDSSGSPVKITYQQPFANKFRELSEIETADRNPRVKRAGYRFVGYFAPDGTCVYGPDYKPTILLSPYWENVTLTARWEVDSSILSVTSSGDGASALDVYGNTKITLRDAVKALAENPLLVGEDGRRRVTFETLDENDTIIRLASQIEVPSGTRSFEINGLYGLTNGVRLVAGQNASHIVFNGKASDGGMFSLASLTFEGLDFPAATHGGCVRIEGEASASIDACSFLGNRKTGKHNGAAISVVSYQRGSELLVSSSTFAGNYCENHGGAVFVHGAHALFVNTTFSDNTAGDLGGAIIESGGGRVDLLDCTFAHNSARAGCSIYSANSNAVVRAVNCIFADEKKTWGAVAMSGGKLTTDWCSMDADPAVVFAGAGAAVTQVVAGVTHVIYQPLGGANALNEDAAEIYCDASYMNIRAVGRDGREVVLAGNKNAAKIPFLLDQLASVRTAPTRGAVRLAVGTEPVTVEIDGVLRNPDGSAKANATVETPVTVYYDGGETATTNLVVKTAKEGVFGLSVPVDGSDGLGHNVTGIKVDALGPDRIEVATAPYALTAASVDLIGSNEFVELEGDDTAIGNVVARSLSAKSSFDARNAGSFTAGSLRGFSDIDLENIAVSGGQLDWLGGANPANSRTSFANLANMTFGGGVEAFNGTISVPWSTQTRSWKAEGDGFVQLRIKAPPQPASDYLMVRVLVVDASGNEVFTVTPRGTFGGENQKALWTVPIRKGQALQLKLDENEQNKPAVNVPVNVQFIYFGVPEQ